MSENRERDSGHIYCHCGLRASHHIEYDDDGNSTDAWFECANGHQWTNYKLSEELTGGTR